MGIPGMIIQGAHCPDVRYKNVRYVRVYSIIKKYSLGNVFILRGVDFLREFVTLGVC